MTIKRRLLLLRHVFKLLTRLFNQLDALESILPKLTALGPILEKIGDLDKRVSELAILEATVPRLIQLDEALMRLQRLGHETPAVTTQQPVPVAVSSNGHDQEMNRLKLLSQFVKLSGKAQEIELEWQKIQQDENNAYFAYQVMRGDATREHAYRKGIVDGIKWCVNRFS